MTKNGFFFPISERTSRYMLWRRKKSPWFGTCRRRLIRRRTKNNQRDTRANKLKLINNQKFIITSDPLQPTQKENKPNDESAVANNLEYIVTKNTDDKKESSGTDSSSATIVSPKAVSAPSEMLFSDKTDNLLCENSESQSNEKKLSGISSPTLPSKRQISCDISVDTSSSRHMTLRSPPACSMMLRSPPLRVFNFASVFSV